jgi:type IV secretion system protein VirB6
MLALTPLFAVLGGTIMLELAVPVLAALVEAPGQIDPRAAMAFFLVGAVHVALMAMVLKVSATMVAGWQVFGIAVAGEGSERSALAATSGAMQLRQPDLRYAASAATGARRIDLGAVTTGTPVNDAGGNAGPTRARKTRAYATSAASASASEKVNSQSRTRGIGNRFRPVQSRALARKPEMS